MKILMVIHGYPKRYNAGSEIYTQMLTHGLSKNHEVRVFTRKENPFEPNFSISQEKEYYQGNEILIDLVNVAQQKDRYQSDGVDIKFKEIIQQFQPEIVHFQHLNHLSLGMVRVVKNTNAKLIFTLHDYWLACPRGQFIQINYGEPEPLRVCNGQDDLKCATRCYSRYYRGVEEYDRDIEYWKSWVQTRQEIIETIVDDIDLFIAPSYHLMERMKRELHIDQGKIVYLDYGFDMSRLKGRKRYEEDSLVFGFIGTHTAPKGIQHLLKAFDMLSGDTKLRIWGRRRSEITDYLNEIHNNMTKNKSQVEWLSEYANEDIVSDVFNQVDVIVVPSIWDENSPLVIHEALQCRIPVITAGHGGMAEYVQDKKNGLLFDFRDIGDLASKMQHLIDQPNLIETLGTKGYLQSETGNIVSMDEHLQQIEILYDKIKEGISWVTL